PQRPRAAHQHHREVVARVNVRLLAVADLHQRETTAVSAAHIACANVLVRCERRRQGRRLHRMRRIVGQELRGTFTAPGKKKRDGKNKDAHDGISMWLAGGVEGLWSVAACCRFGVRELAPALGWERWGW